MNRQSAWVKFTFHHVSIKTIHYLNKNETVSLFTFHHVSIKTGQYPAYEYNPPNSHSTMYLLKLMPVDTPSRWYSNSHSTMYLLKLLSQSVACTYAFLFTFHHVSIKTAQGNRRAPPDNHSHSTMYLLKHCAEFCQVVTEHHSHSTMYLLKPFCYLVKLIICQNSHSTMYLLKHMCALVNEYLIIIHIPPCIY